MSIFKVLDYLIKNKDPNNIFSINFDGSANDLKLKLEKFIKNKENDEKLKLEKFIKNKETDEELKKCFQKMVDIGSLGYETGILNIFNLKKENNLFGIYYINKKIKYLKINCDKIKNILDEDDNTMVLSYLVNLNKIV